MRSLTFLSGASVALAASAQETLSSTSKDPFTSTLDSFVTDTMAKWHFPGMAIGIIDGSETFFKVRPPLQH